MPEPTNNLPPHNGKSATLFSGGEGAGLGMVAAGFSHAWGIEYSDDIAQVARDNGLNVLTADILECDPADFESVDWLHASPPCPNFSNAKTNGKETENDRALAAKVCQFATELLPRIFTLENVYQYRKSQSWQTIAAALLTNGYQVNYWHVNMADYGVPQTRKRMIVIARRDGITPMLPPATHAETPVNGFFERRQRWVSWYEAIEDLIPTLPDSEFAKWQLERLPDEFRNLYLSKDKGDYSDGHAHENEPAVTVTANDYGRRRAFIAPGGNATSFSIRNEDEPARVIGDVDRVGNIPRAYLAPIQGEATSGFTDDLPAQTVAANHVSGKYRAFVVDGKLSSSDNKKVLQINDAVTPSGTVVASHSAFRDSRAFVVNDSDSKNPIRQQEKPHATVMASGAENNKAFTNGRVVKMTPRALARFQAFPDGYELPDNNALACRIIGNAVPPLFMQRIGESIK